MMMMIMIVNHHNFLLFLGAHGPINRFGFVFSNVFVFMVFSVNRQFTFYSFIVLLSLITEQMLIYFAKSICV